MPSSTLKTKPIIVEVTPTGGQIALHETIGIKEAAVSMVAPEISKSVIDDDSIALPISVDLAEHSNINHFLIFGQYAESDVPAGIAAGDYAPIEVELNNSGVFITVDSYLDLGGKITALKYKKKNTDTRKIKVTRLLSATGI